MSGADGLLLNMSKVTSCRSKQNQHSATSGTGFSESAHRGRSAFKISTYQRSWCKHRHQTAALCKVSRSVVFLCSDSARASWQITTSEWMRDSMLETMVRQLGKQMVEHSKEPSALIEAGADLPEHT